MSPRPLKIRRVSNPPKISGLKPYGTLIEESRFECVFLQYEEYEALRLCDYEMMNHQQASDMMNVSRPTLTRIYAQARSKLADAIVNGKQVIIEGGKVYFDSEWHTCLDCGCYFNHIEKLTVLTNCPLCGNTHITNYDKIPDETFSNNSPCIDLCVCPSCGFEQEHQKGNPCVSLICPKCKKPLQRKNSPQNHKFNGK